ncbi:MAG: efflux RND transporter permease subunit [Longimicrobiales bacterium]|nr:efflux RND transporter permease subunit [Longimicrobiales bacterium]
MKGRFAGKLADLFLDSKLTPLLMAAALGVGAYSLMAVPSEEEPQIIVPLADIYMPLPGATPEEVENRVLIPVEQVLSGIEGVEYVYTHAEPGFGLATVRYEVGRDMEESLVRLYSELMGNADRMPPGLAMPLVKTVTIDDVPFFTATLYGGGEDGAGLRRLAEELKVDLEKTPDVRRIDVIGGEPREIRVELRPDELAAHGIDPGMVVARLEAANTRTEAGTFTWRNEVIRVTAGPFLASARDVEGVVLDVRGGEVIQVKDVATVIDGPAEVTSYTFHMTRRPGGGSVQASAAGAEQPIPEAGSGGEAGNTAVGTDWWPLVTLAVAKRPGADATELGHRLEGRLEELRGRVIPEEVSVEITRNYGETAEEKVSTLQEHLVMAVLAVGMVVLLTMGWRSAVVVMMAVPVTFALTLFVYHVFGYTLNRVTLFALIFVTGIVIDDSIIVAENMARHFAMRDRPLRAAARAAVDEVGNPTILATLTVIAAVLPMLFVSGLMGPYMSPMPIGATVAMIFSLLVALIITPWLAFRLLKGEVEEEGEAYVLEETLIYRAYRWAMQPLLDRPRMLVLSLGGVTLLLAGAVGMFFTRTVTVKMLPFDDKNEMQVIVDLPEGTPLETTADLTAELGRAVLQVPEVADVQLHAGTAAPFNFNGMIRHYYLRQGPHVADLQVNLVDKGERDAQSHDVAKRIRPLVQAVAEASGTGARVKVVEVPPGPPVLSTLVAEVYGPTPEERERVAREVRTAFEEHPGVVDVDWSLTDPRSELRFRVDEERAMLSGVAKEQVVGGLRVALAGQVATHLSEPTSRTPVPVRVRVGEGKRSGRERLAGLQVASRSGEMVPVGELVEVKEARTPQVVDRKNGRPVVYVTADVAGEEESPVYAILDLRERLGEIDVAGEGTLGQLFARQPGAVERPVMKWDGEWQITYEVFRDLGIAFAGALLLIYVLIVAWFGSFTTPLVMMAAIPLTLVGIAPGHWAFGAFFTATSMIGMIALAGIMVRNGILLVDYLEARLEAGRPLKDAVIEAGAVRTRPIVLTAGTVVIGAFVILFDPIFQGLAVSLITGAVASTVLTLLVVPGIYFLLRRGG